MELSIVIVEHRFLATFFKPEINGLGDGFLMKIEENVNPGTEKRQFSKIPFENLKNMQSQIVVCDQQQSNIITECEAYYM